jgi:hypothetical protein
VIQNILAEFDLTMALAGVRNDGRCRERRSGKSRVSSSPNVGMHEGIHLAKMGTNRDQFHS